MINLLQKEIIKFRALRRQLPHPVDLIHEELREELLELVLLPLRDVHGVVADLRVRVPAEHFIHTLLKVPTRQIMIIHKCRAYDLKPIIDFFNNPPPHHQLQGHWKGGEVDYRNPL